MKAVLLYSMVKREAHTDALTIGGSFTVTLCFNDPLVIHLTHRCTLLIAGIFTAHLVDR